MCWLWTHKFNHNKSPKASRVSPHNLFIKKTIKVLRRIMKVIYSFQFFNTKKIFKGQSYAKAIGKEKKTLSTVTFTVYDKNQNATGMQMIWEESKELDADGSVMLHPEKLRMQALFAYAYVFISSSSSSFIFFWFKPNSFTITKNRPQSVWEDSP